MTPDQALHAADVELEKAKQLLNVASKVACPHCHATKSHVVDARRRPNQKGFRRRRVCLTCAKRFWTIEVVEPQKHPNI